MSFNIKVTVHAVGIFGHQGNVNSVKRAIIINRTSGYDFTDTILLINMHWSGVQRNCDCFILKEKSHFFFRVASR